MDQLSVKLRSDHTKDEVYDIVSAERPDVRWSRGDSGNQGAWYVKSSGWPGRVSFWCFDEEPGVIYADIAARSDQVTGDELVAWQRSYIRSVLRILPAIGDVPPLSSEERDFLQM